ncbi:alkaline phosphatase family protein [Halogeometricum limi]|uniref:Type I phosphodiesterase / nucleotide pyrophosphatase n=1 Tax=Halogeometricum limi TaxID=555875 RepID=A0A1I6IPF3_9EURY|nr:nucleotide pyrophosphatase/phosphodiesterase family protein [Halogeometricum limi]SFR68613.1 Type I phosphodiesterase / nucleotide pyrophosphatase [Halogeometricum limi]
MTERIAERVVVLDIVGLQPDHVDAETTPNLARLFDDGATTGAVPPFPAVTIPSQTTLSTGTAPATHGDVSNAEYDRETDTVELWGRNSGDRKRVWEVARDAGVETGALFFQHLYGTSADVAVTPKPIEDENNDLIEMNCWTNPDEFYEELREEYGHFPLHNYWGPAANAESSKWILSAAREATERYDPEMLWTYLPHLDYTGQSHGPDSEAFAGALSEIDELVGDYLSFLESTPAWEETAVVVVSEYGFHDVSNPVFPNRALREAGLMKTRDADDSGRIPDLDASEAFAVVDHQVAHVYCDQDAVETAREALEALDGIERILDGDDQAAYGIDHQNAGDLVLVADPDAWFAYYWWNEGETEAMPPYADSVDIHEKPGYDPCELFLGDTGFVSTDPSNVRGSHGRVDEETMPFFGIGGPAAPSLSLDGDIDMRQVAPTVLDLLGVHDEVEMPFEGASILAPTSELGPADD